METITTRQIRKAANNSSYPKDWISFSKYTFVVNQSSVLRINICAENPAHRKSANRYGQSFRIILKLKS